MVRSALHVLVQARALAGVAAVAVALAACGSASPTASPASAAPPAATAATSVASASAAPAQASSPTAAPDAEVAEPSPESSPEAASTTRIPVVSCPTTYGVDQPSPSPLPTALSAIVDADLAGTVAFYGTEGLTVLAPKGWDCTAAVGADGSSSLVVTPPGSPLASGSPAPDQQAVTAYSDGACVGCIATDACPVFPEAWSLFATPGAACPATIPTEEKITRRLPQTAVFLDPPHVAGTGSPSGGTYRALGFMVFDPGYDALGDRADPPSLLKVTCTLPDALARVCEELVEGVR
jgi:hypothetical protein